MNEEPTVSLEDEKIGKLISLSNKAQVIGERLRAAQQRVEASQRQLIQNQLSLDAEKKDLENVRRDILKASALPAS